MSNYILNINKYRSTTTPQIVGRVADLPKLPIDVQVLDGDKPVDLTSATVEFRGVTPTDKKIIVTSGITVTNKLTGSFTFTFPKNFYTSPGRFKRAYFVIKRGERLDSTQDLIIHVIESIDFDLDESEDIIEGLDQVIKEVTDKMNKETQAMIDAIQKEYDNLEKLLNQQAQNNIAKIDKEIKIAIDESKLRMRQLESEYRGVINNAQSTLNQLNKELDEIKPYIDETNKIIDKMDTRLKELEKNINDNDLVKRPELQTLQDDLQVKNNQITHGVDYIEPPLRGYKQGETWKPSEDDVGPFNMLREISNVFDNKTIAQGTKVNLDFDKVSVPEWGNNEYVRITSHTNDFVGRNRARKSVGRYVFQNPGEKFTVQIDIANLGETDMIVLVNGLAGSKSELVGKKSVRSLVFQGERTTGDFHIQFNAVIQEENISFAARNDFVTKGHVTMPYSENPYTLAGESALKAIKSNNTFNVEDFEKTADYNKLNLTDMQAQIDELEKIVTALGGS